ncbi:MULTISPECIES: DUF2309 domain-containing protein [Nocardiopsidaceae]|uniref:Probable inorganic carbon transporter subunit DabA n=2 Tax=Nocardiopsidaceae TaxID=83676 RepID=A0A2P8CRD9_9ACTN|nr:MULTISPECIES: DUF2309 domain-containing protein [Nocardiopsaceae]MEE2051613.1 DUF2309 domain-containing protein [Nocardiopsis umidischolae]PSK87516.1 hypothetical protein CLV63_13169 [Murinocardiopsis flavida]
MTTGPITKAAPDTATSAAEVRAVVADAAAFLAPTWPLADFIAVNPLSGLVDRPFADAAIAAADLFGARVTPEEAWLRAAWRHGRITDDDVRAALIRRHPEALRCPPLTLGGRTYEPVDLLSADLHQGITNPPPIRRARTATEVLAPDMAALLDTHTIQWCSAYLDEGQSTWRMPGRDRGFYHAWRALAAHDVTLPRRLRTRLGDLPERDEQAVAEALAALGVPEDQRTRYLQAHLACLPGFAAHIRWRGERQDSGIDLVAYLALRLTTEAAALTGTHTHGTAWNSASADLLDTRQATTGPEDRARHLLEALEITGTDAAQRTELARLLDRLPVEQRTLVWLDAYEDHYRSRLLRTLSRSAPEWTDAPPRAQVVCCIDPRSEGLRRHLEALGDYQTLGFAGFFAVAMRYRDLAGGAARAQCPGPITPRHTVTERPSEGRQRAAERSLTGRRVLAAADHSLHAAKDDLVAPFVLAESAGWLLGPLAAARTFAPGAVGAARAWWTRRITADPATEISLEDALTPEERTATAEGILTLMGLTRGFARLVVLCGHRAHTDNNPYQAALDCGACGGHPGGPNARTAAALLNDPQVRRHLSERGIGIPDDTRFVPAEHDTTTDTVRLLDTHLLPDTHGQDVDRLTADLRTAGAHLAAERCATLPGAPSHPSPRRAARHTRTRARDWAQAFPEWGLAGNAAFLIAPRALTRGIDLHGRLFLHDYDPDLDPAGTVLETILTAPLVVAHWINSQYYFAATDPQAFGAGSKALHNAVGGGLGVMTGPTGDLRSGLPWQSLTDGHRARHEPQRLLTIVQAPLHRLDTLIGRHTVLRHMFDHDWVGLAAREHPDQPWLRYTPTGWRPWCPAAAAPEDGRPPAPLRT